ncbi:MAG TPA: membrane-bound lytic murein transglycosylase MltF, partial [Steroidobacteraceae bacterium]|nr:membrane-bound lytic murein transglycosylase MltF [Steroidobacteraceae bacterium]
TPDFESGTLDHSATSPGRAFYTNRSLAGLLRGIVFFAFRDVPLLVRILVAIVAALLLGTCSQPGSVLDRVLASGELRVVTRNSPSAYYLGANGPQGPEDEMASRLASELGVSLYIYPVATVGEVLEEVSAGRAHIAAAGLTYGQPLPDQVAFGPRYQQVKEHLVYRFGSPKPRNLLEASSGHIEVAARSAHTTTLIKQRRDDPELTWVENPNAETDELLDRLTAREIDYTIADSNEFAISRAYHPEIRVAFDLQNSKALAWVVNTRDNTLLNRVTAYFASAQADGQLASILDRYYNNVRRFEYVEARDFLTHADERLPMYRAWFKEAAATVAIDWRLLAAIGYQESQWTPSATSPTGVRGIMMLTEDTARSLGVPDRLEPRGAILGGAQYFVMMRNQVPPRIRDPDRTWFALAAYNVGFGHLEDARVLTQSHGKNPDAWDDVRRFLPLLSQEKWYARIKHGYARGWEPVRFVENIRSYYDMLQWTAVDTAETETQR